MRTGQLAALLLCWAMIRADRMSAVADGDPYPAAMMGPGDFGSLVLCPPGGKSFRMAWSLACEVRKKRSTRPMPLPLSSPDVTQNSNPLIIQDSLQTLRSTQSHIWIKGDIFGEGSQLGRRTKRDVPAGYRPATLTDIQKICCIVGCEIRDLLSYCDPFGPWNS